MWALGCAGAAASLAACAGEGPEGAAASTVRDSAGVRIVENPAPLRDSAQAWSVGPAVATVGGTDGDLFDVSGAVLLPDGAFAVGVAGTSQVRFYDREGGLQAAWGAEGDGPGEFRLMAHLGRAGGDTVWVHDYGHARVDFLTAADGFTGSVTLTPPLSAGMVVGRRSDGSFVLGQMWGTPDGELREGPARDPAAWVVYGADGAPEDTLGLFPGREVLHRREGERMTMVAMPFARMASDALLGDDLVVGDQVGYGFTVLGAAGPAMIVRWRGEPLRLTDDEVSRWKEERIAEAGAAERPSVRAWLAEAPLPPTRPAYGASLTDPSGAIWVADFAPPGAEPSRWNVFSSAGRWLGPVTLPTGFHLLAVGADRVIGVVRDALDVERVEVRGLTRPTP